MSDIKIDVSTGDSISRIKQLEAQLSNLQAKFKNLDTKKVSDGMKNVNDRVQTTTKSFNLLGTAISAIGFGALIQNAYNSALAITNAANASGLAAETVQSFTTAVAANGGSVREAAGKLVEFTSKMDEARQGSLQMQKELGGIGINIKDLKTLGEEDLFKKLVTSLAQIEDSSKRNRLAAKYLGDEFKKIDVRDVAKSMATKPVIDVAAYTSAAEAQKNISKELSKLEAAIIQVSKPLNDLVKQINVSTQAWANFLSAIITVIKYIALLYVGLRVLRAAWGFVKLIADADKVLKGFAATSSNAWKIFKETANAALDNIVKLIGFVISNLNKLAVLPNTISAKIISAFTALIAPISNIIVPITGLIVGIVTAMITFIEPVRKAIIDIAVRIDESITGILKNAVKKVQDWYRGFAKFISNLTFGQVDIGVNIEEPKPTGNQLSEGEVASEIERLKARSKANLSVQREVIDAMAQQRKELALINQQAKNNINALETDLQTRLQSLSLEKQLVGLGEEQAEIVKSLADLDNERFSKTRDLVTQLINLNTELRFAQTPEEKAAIEARRKATIDEIHGVARLYSIHRENLPGYIRDLQIARDVERIRTQNFEASVRALEEQAEAYHEIFNIVRDIKDQEDDIKFQIKVENMGELDRQLATIRRNTEKMIRERGAQIAALPRFQDNGDGLTPEKMAELAAALAKMRSEAEALGQTQIDQLYISRQWSSGWERAFNDYIDNMMNAANVAKTQFDIIFGGINSALDGFVDNAGDAWDRFGTNGKDVFRSFGRYVEDTFKSMVGNILKNLIKLQIQMAFTKMMAEGKGAIGGLIGALFGPSIAAAPTGMAGAPVMGLPGWANGGEPPVGKLSIVGEQGPELFVPKTAGTIIPNHALNTAPVINNNTYVTNNISAVDSQSVAKLFSDNRRTLLGVTEQARSELPMRNRF